MGDDFRQQLLEKIRDYVMPAKLLYDDAGDPSVQYIPSLTDYGAYETAIRTVYVGPLAFKNALSVFRTMMHEGVHAWDHHHGLIAYWNNHGGYSRAMTEVRAYEMQRWFSGGILSGVDLEKYNSYSNMVGYANRIKHYPTFFNNIQR